MEMPIMKQAVMVLLLCASSVYAAPKGGFPSPADYDVYGGSISFKNFGNHMIGILLIDERGRAGGYVHLFRLWTEASLNPISVNAVNASVEFRGRELVILVPEKQLFYTFVLSDAQFGSPTPPTGFTSVRYVGYGLNHEVRPTALKRGGSSSGRAITSTIDICSDGGVDCYLNEDPGVGGGSGGGGTSCDDGGPGANACSVNSNAFGGCSVGCSSGYYACCNGGSFTSEPHCYCAH